MTSSFISTSSSDLGVFLSETGVHMVHSKAKNALIRVLEKPVFVHIPDCDIDIVCEYDIGDKKVATPTDDEKKELLRNTYSFIRYIRDFPSSVRSETDIPEPSPEVHNLCLFSTILDLFCDYLSDIGFPGYKKYLADCAKNFHYGL
jgi:hypothetical protein